MPVHNSGCNRAPETRRGPTDVHAERDPMTCADADRQDRPRCPNKGRDLCRDESFLTVSPAVTSQTPVPGVSSTCRKLWTRLRILLMKESLDLFFLTSSGHKLIDPVSLSMC